MDMGKETYSKNCKDSQIHVHIEIKKIIKVCVITSQQAAQYGGVLGGEWRLWEKVETQVENIVSGVNFCIRIFEFWVMVIHEYLEDLFGHRVESIVGEKWNHFLRDAAPRMVLQGSNQTLCVVYKLLLRLHPNRLKCTPWVLSKSLQI